MFGVVDTFVQGHMPLLAFRKFGRTFGTKVTEMRIFGYS